MTFEEFIKNNSDKNIEVADVKEDKALLHCNGYNHFGTKIFNLIVSKDRNAIRAIHIHCMNAAPLVGQVTLEGNFWGMPCTIGMMETDSLPEKIILIANL